MFGRLILLSLILITTSSCDVAENDPVVPDQDNSLGVIFPLASYSYLQTFSNPNAGFNMKYHCAEDAYGNGGTPVYAIMDGVVSFSDQASGYGWLLTIDHENKDVYSLYGHLSTKRFKKVTGDSVYCGEIIAYLADDEEDGSGDIASGFEYPYWPPHLHFGIRNGMISDYPDTGDTRWSAGYTEVLPSTIGWLNPSAFIISEMNQATD